MKSAYEYLSKDELIRRVKKDAVKLNVCKNNLSLSLDSDIETQKRLEASDEKLVDELAINAHLCNQLIEITEIHDLDLKIILKLKTKFTDAQSELISWENGKYIHPKVMQQLAEITEELAEAQAKISMQETMLGINKETLKDALIKQEIELAESENNVGD